MRPVLDSRQNTPLADSVEYHGCPLLIGPLLFNFMGLFVNFGKLCGFTPGGLALSMENPGSITALIDPKEPPDLKTLPRPHTPWNDLCTIDGLFFIGRT